MQKLIFNDFWKLFDKYIVILFFKNSLMRHFPRNSDDVCGGLMGHVYVLLRDHKSTCVWTSSFLLNKWLLFHVFNNTSLFLFSLILSQRSIGLPRHLLLWQWGYFSWWVAPTHSQLEGLFHCRQAVNAQKEAGYLQISNSHRSVIRSDITVWFH